MRLSLEEFENSIERYIKMQDQCNKLADFLGVSEFIFDDWLNNYYMLLDYCCDFEEKDYNGWFGSPLSCYLFYDHVYTDENGNEIILENPTVLYNYILSMHS